MSHFFCFSDKELVNKIIRFFSHFYDLYVLNKTNFHPWRHSSFDSRGFKLWITWILSCITSVLWLFSTCISFPFKKLSTFFGTVTKLHILAFVQLAHIVINFLAILTVWQKINKRNFQSIPTSPHTTCPILFKTLTLLWRKKQA